VSERPNLLEVFREAGQLSLGKKCSVGTYISGAKAAWTITSSREGKLQQAAGNTGLYSRMPRIVGQQERNFTRRVRRFIR
jgi:hypothetical protein